MLNRDLLYPEEANDPSTRYLREFYQRKQEFWHGTARGFKKWLNKPWDFHEREVAEMMVVITKRDLDLNKLIRFTLDAGSEDATRLRLIFCLIALGNGGKRS